MRLLATGSIPLALAFVVSLTVSLTLPAPLRAQNANTQVRGVIESVDSDHLVIKDRDSQLVSIQLPADVRIIHREAASLASIKPGDFVGSAAVEGPDGKLRAQEVHIFAEALRGQGEGHRPMAADPAAPGDRTMTNATVAEVTPARSMTNATVTGVAGDGGERVLSLKYPQGTTEIIVAPNTPITRMSLGDRSVLKAGAMVAVTTQARGTGLVATVINLQ